MKQINVWFDDGEHADLVKAKGDSNWHDFILQLKTKGETSHLKNDGDSS